MQTNQGVGWRINWEKRQRTYIKLKDENRREEVSSEGMKKIIEEFYCLLYKKKKIEMQKISEYLRAKLGPETNKLIAVKKNVLSLMAVETELQIHIK